MTDVHPKLDQMQPGTIPGFASLPLPPKLYVPISSGQFHAELPELRTGPVARGQALLNAPSASAFTPIAPAPGKVAGMTHVQLTTARQAPAIVLEVLAENIEDTAIPPVSAPLKLAPLLDRLQLAGIWADRKTSPDLLGQLHAAMKRPIDLVICNLLEADGAPLNAAIVRGAADRVVAAALALARATSARLQIVADHKSREPADEALRQLRHNTPARVVDLANDYPQADPTILLYMLTGRRLRPGRLPIEQGVIILDGIAALAGGQCLLHSVPMIEVPLVIRQRGLGQVHLISAAVGTPLCWVLDQLDLPARDITIRAGAALRDIRIGPDAVIGGGEVRLDIGPTELPPNPDPCIRCGWCVAACPTRIHPAGLLEAAQHSDKNLADFYGIQACIECGICSYVCPSRLPLLQSIRTLKTL